MRSPSFSQFSRSTAAFARRSILAAAALLAAVLPATLAAQAGGSIAGRVTDEGGVPIVGVAVIATGTTSGALTANDGTYRFTVRPGTYEVRARLIGYAPAAATVTVAEGATVTRDFRLAHAATTLSAVAVVGSRGEARTVINSPVPIDVLTPADIKSTGRTETAQILQQLAPSVNFPRATISDGTDAVRPATLRGLAPDQVLVLVNGKRRHGSALVNVNGSIGRGSTSVDLNAIPASMIDHIEVLREGAAAQYGSDAIAGVINIVLKSTAPGELSTTLGETATKYKDLAGDERSAHDGQVGQVALNGGVSRGPNSFLHGDIEFRGRGYTNRSFGDPRPQSFSDVNNGVTYTNESGPINHRQGDAATSDYLAFLNGGYNFGSGGPQLYGFAGASHRVAEAAGFFRRSQDARTVRSLWPNGFLPLIHSTVIDGSGTVGVKGNAAGFRYDLSSVYGRNTFDFDVLHSNNVSLGNASPTDFYAGQLRFDQSTTNLDLFRELHVADVVPVRVGFGAEYRRDGYRIGAGERASYVNGGQFVLDTLGNPTTTHGAPGAQVFPGFRPAADTGGNTVDASRHNTALYADVESDLTQKLLLDVAGRYEDYSDFGSTSNGRAAARYTIIPQVVLRGSLGTGFRAPSLAQTYFSSTATNFSGGVARDVVTLPVSSPDARALGAQPLRPEKSHNYGAGVALEPLPTLGITVDYYQILISDRIVLSGTFVGDSIVQYFARQNRAVTGARYFTNAIDTKTGGVDVVANYGLDFGRRGASKFTLGYNRTQTRITHIKPTPTALGNQGETLFDVAERARIQEGQPRSNVLASINYDLGRFGVNLRGQRFGAVTARNAPSTPQVRDQTFGAKTITDVALSYRFLDRLSFTAGADNVLDVYPDVNDQNGNTSSFGGNANFGIFPYNQVSPFGFNGRFIYGRLSYGF